MSAHDESTGGGLRQSLPERIAAAGGAIFALLFGVGFVLHGLAAGSDNGESRAEVVARYTDGGNEALAHMGGLLIGFALIFFLPFLGRLRQALREVEGGRGVFSTTAVAGGAVMAAMAAVSAAVAIAAISSSDYYDAYQVNPDVVLLMQTLSFTAVGYVLVSAAVLVVATSIVALRTGLFPRWLGIAGCALAVVCAFGEWALWVTLPLLLLLLWLFMISTALVVRDRRPRPASPSALRPRERKSA